MTQTMIVTPATAQSWQKALNRAIAEALDVYVATDGTAFVESSSQAGLLYIVTRESCSCPAGERGIPCKHRACFLAQIGELPLEPASRVSLFGNSDRQTIEIDGRYYGFAAFADDSGWTVWRGKGLHARKCGTYATLAEIERVMEERLPVNLRASTEVRVVSPMADTTEMASVA